MIYRQGSIQPSAVSRQPWPLGDATRMATLLFAQRARSAIGAISYQLLAVGHAS
ncbi:MAG: hypothetical protein F6J98_18420 [Moorea sp. SIO4G2]|uniref:hypothetical protein n=1 Tax=Moorena TaxID=1155738 RepID=UPI0013019058|nr:MULTISPECIES: hypothetical protein [Moorena]NEO25267.1 hypothetical protein [Moorena sp. SIO4A5]NEO62301.1 hypothetical protein [Moorena sp. SIO4G2]NEP27831.1 hypothetical protein [Moorena sp. SIO3I6]